MKKNKNQMPPMDKKGFRPKEKIDKKSLAKLLKFAKPLMPLIILSVICAIIGSIATIIGPNKISDLTNIIYDGVKSPLGIDMDAFKSIVLTLLIIYLVGALFNYMQQYIMAIVTNKTSKTLRTKIDEKLNKLPLNFFDSESRGDILSRVTNDVDTISETLGSSIANLVSAAVLFIGLLIMMFTVNWLLALVTIASSFLGFFLLMIPMRFSQKHFNQKQKNLGIMNGQIEEVYSNHIVIKSYTSEEEEINKFISINNELFHNNWKSQFISGFMMPIMNFIGNLSYALIFLVGFSLILNHQMNMTYGIIMSFVIYARLISNPLQTFAQSMTSLQQSSAASRRVFEILEKEEMEDEENKTITLEKIEGNVTFQDVRFGYIENKEIIHGFSSEFKSGQKVAIVGPTGAGKTTIVNLLMRFYEVNSGDILIDGIKTKDMKRDYVESLFDMILQDTWLFRGTIRENLVYNKKNVKDEQISQAIDAVGLHHFIEALPKGLDTMLDDTLALSEGQKQQLTIARAMIKDAPMLILDEATSSVDTRTELIIQEAMDKLTIGRTSFVIAHRLSTIKNADIILVLKDGDIVEQGNHQDLLSKQGFYYELYNSQFELV